MPGKEPAPDSSSSGPDDINNRLAEIAAELATEAKFKEPSAAERARALARQHKASGPAPARRGGGPLRSWQARRTAAKLSRPVQQPGGPLVRTRKARARKPATAAAQRAGARPTPDRGYASPTRRPGPSRSVFAIALLAAFVLAVSFGLRDLLHSRGSGAAPNPGGSTATTPTGLSTVKPLAFNPAAPFAGTPAQGYADGAAGIVLPAARSYGQFSAAEVAAAYRTVRQLLIASHLNTATINGGSPAAFTKLLLATQERSWFIRNLNKTGLSKQGYERSSRDWVISFAPGTTELIGSVIKVHGSMTAAAAHFTHQPALLIHADYLFVYPVEAPGQPGSGMRIVARVWLNVYFGPWNEPASQQIVPWIGQIRGSPAGARCDTEDGFVHPAFPTGPPQHVKASGATINPYDLSTPPPTTGGCHPSTGT